MFDWPEQIKLNLNTSVDESKNTMKLLTVIWGPSWERLAEVQGAVEHCIDVLQELHVVGVWAPRKGRGIWIGHRHNHLQKQNTTDWGGSGATRPQNTEGKWTRNARSQFKLAWKAGNHAHSSSLMFVKFAQLNLSLCRQTTLHLLLQFYHNTTLKYNTAVSCW